MSVASAHRVSELEPLVSRARIASPAGWPIKPGLAMLNAGSYGMTPAVVSDAQSELRRRMDRDPVHFFKVDLEKYADAARDALARFVGCPFDDLTFMPNGTVAVATVLNAIEFEPGDEIVVTDHEYQATMNEISRVCARTGAKRVTAHIPFPRVTPDAATDAVLGVISARTKLVVVSHISSATGLVFHVKHIIDGARARGVEVLVDGAHAPGQLPLNIDALAPTYYAASCHKWLNTPKGTGFLYADPSVQSKLMPLALSCRTHLNRPGRNPFLRNFDYMGTSDYTANLVMPVAIEHGRAQLPGGWDAIYARNNDLIRRAGRLVCARLGLEQPVPGEMVGSMIGVRLPDHPGGRATGELYDDPLWDRLVLDHRIQVPVWELPGVASRIMRLSAQLFNTIGQYERLGEVLAVELAREKA